MMNFSIVIPGVLAGSARPRTYHGGDELADLKANGVCGIVSLTEVPLSGEDVEGSGLAYLHIPIRDFGVPRMKDVDSFVEFVRRVSEERGGPVLVHCGSGYGRTGTMLACYLVTEGHAAEEAIREVRRMRPGSIETAGQEGFVFEWHRRCEGESP